jgi:hypothetical protein
MRVIHNKQPGREAAVVPPVTKEVSDPAVDTRPEYEATCTNCLSQIAFRRTDPEVTTTNELEFILNCPVCATELHIGEVTGITRSRR